MNNTLKKVIHILDFMKGTYLKKKYLEVFNLVNNYVILYLYLSSLLVIRIF